MSSRYSTSGAAARACRAFVSFAEARSLRAAAEVASSGMAVASGSRPRARKTSFQNSRLAGA